MYDLASVTWENLRPEHSDPVDGGQLEERVGTAQSSRKTKEQRFVEPLIVCVGLISGIRFPDKDDERTPDLPADV